MIIIISEIFEIVKDFYKMRNKKGSEILLINGAPVLIGIITFLIGILITKRWDADLLDFTSDFVNQLITVLALFISFSIAYIGMLITSGSKVVDDMKKKDSTHYFLAGKPVKVYQSIHCMMTYTILIEVIFMVIVFAQKFLIYLMDNTVMKIFLCFDITILMHIIILIGIQIRDVYFSFWKPE